MSKSKRKGKASKVSRPKSYYQLSEIWQKIDEGAWLIRPDAYTDAYRDFGWGITEIANAFKMLRPKHFYKTDTSKIDPLRVMDFYKARLNGEDIYTHFYIDDVSNQLVINSFKKI